MNQQTFVFVQGASAKRRDGELAKPYRDALARHGGELHEVSADAVVIRMVRATDAVSLGLSVARGLPRGGASTLRTGVHTGRAGVDPDGGWSGSVVELAAAVAQLAEPGQVLVTSATRQATDRGQIDFIEIGHHALDGGGPPVTLYRAKRVIDIGPSA